ncbi:MAG: flagellar motor switch protein FliM [Nitrospiria bacterium]
MGEKILSQDEVEALLRGVSGGEVDTEQEEVSDGGTRDYDLTNQERIIRGRMPSLEIINERFARLFQVSMSGFLKKDVEMFPVSVTVPKFGELMRKIPLPSSINVLKMDPLRGHILLILDTKFVYRLIDLYFGGSGQTYVKIEGRNFTAIEERVIRKVVEMILIDLEKSWKAVFSVAISHVRAEINPQFAAIVAPTEVVVTTTFKLEIEDEGGDIFIGLPYPTIEPIREKLYGGFQSDQLEENKKWAERFAAQLFECRLNTVAEIGKTTLTVGEVSDLAVGDVIMLNKKAQDDLEIRVAGIPVFKGRPGCHRGNVAYQVTSVRGET